MREGFTKCARDAVLIATYWVDQLMASEIRTEHLLLGILHEEGCSGRAVLVGLGVDIAGLEKQLEERAPKQEATPNKPVKFSAESEQAIEAAVGEALRLNSSHVGTEHLLLGLMSTPGCLAAQVLEEAGIDFLQTRRAVRCLRVDEKHSPITESVDKAPTCPWCGTESEPREKCSSCGLSMAGVPDIYPDAFWEAGQAGPSSRNRGGEIMWQRFTERARRVVFFAQEEAGRLGENYVNTEHLLLGLVRENDSVAARILDRLGVNLGRVRTEIERLVEHGDGRLGQDMQLTPRAKRVIDLAYDEARQLNNNYIGTEHLLLGTIREGEGLAGRVLATLGVELERTRREIMVLQDTYPPTQPPTGNPPPFNPPTYEEMVKNLTGHSPLEEISRAVWNCRKIIETDSLKLRGKSFLSIADLDKTQLEGMLEVASGMVQSHRAKNRLIHWHYPKSLAMIFEKPSLRTRVTFDLGMRQLGGLTTILGPAEIGLGTRESVPDVARNLERWVDCIMARVFDHQSLVQLRDNCSIPIINALSDVEHPCQAVTDLFTIQQKKGKLEGLKLAWVGDGNNVLHSLLLAGALTGMTVEAACPIGYEPDPAIVEQAKKLAGDPTKISIVNDPAAAAADADVVYTDVWTSMGQEKEQLARIQAFRDYQVNAALMAKAKPDAIFLHCLPAHRGDEVTDEVLDSPQSVVFDQAENRLHAQKAILALLIGP
jgi:ornithine carbamoyltransferase